MILSFKDTKIHPVSYPPGPDYKEGTECVCCGKKIWEFGKWKSLVDSNPDSPEGSRKEYLMFGSTESKVGLCINCMIQLKGLEELLRELDPDFLSPRSDI